MAWEQWQLDILAEANGQETISQLADKTGKDRQVVRRYCDRNEIPYTVKNNGNDAYTDAQIFEIEKALEKKDGRTHKQIAESLGVSRSVVSAVSAGTRTQRGAGKVKGAKMSTKSMDAFKKVFG